MCFLSYKRKSKDRSPWQDKRFKNKSIQSLSKHISRVYSEVTSNQAICLAALSCMQATAIPVVLLTNKRRLFSETSVWTPCLYIYPCSFPFWGSIMLMPKTKRIGNSNNHCCQTFQAEAMQ